MSITWCVLGACDTAKCNVTQSGYDQYALTLTLLSCRDRNSGEEVLNTVVDESQSGIPLSSSATLSIALHGSAGGCHRNCSRFLFPTMFPSTAGSTTSTAVYPTTVLPTTMFPTTAGQPFY